MEKIDIINGVIYIYDTEFKLVKEMNLDGFNFNFLGGEYKLLTINLTQPLKRMIKFTELNDLNTTAEFTEFLYDEMSESDKQDLDSFISMLN